METRFKITLVTFLLLVISFQVSGQKKKLISDPDEVIAADTEVMESSMKEEGELFVLGQEYEITGAYTFDLTIRNKGEVVSIFVVEREGGSIPNQNMLKDYIKEMKMGFRMPKDKRYKFRYKFDFTN